MNKIAIIGTGLIGTSLGLAIKRIVSNNTQIVGTDIERRNAGKAEKMGAIDKASGSLGSAVEDAQIVILATPVMAMKDIMEAVGPRLQEGCLVTDTGGSKGVVIEWAQQYLPRSVSFVGGHPLVGKDSSGPDDADGSLFQDRPYCIIPASQARSDAVRSLTDMIRSIGAKPYFMNVTEHDSYVSAVSHLPLLLSAALVGCTSKSPSWDDIAKVASTQFGDITRLASGDPVTHRDMFISNEQGVVYWIDAFIHELYEIRQVLAGEEEGKLKKLESVFSRAITERNRWLAGVVTHQSDSAAGIAQIPSASSGMSELFLGNSEARRKVLGWGDGKDKDTRGKK